MLSQDQEQVQSLLDDALERLWDVPWQGQALAVRRDDSGSWVACDACCKAVRVVDRWGRWVAGWSDVEAFAQRHLDCEVERPCSEVEAELLLAAESRAAVQAGE